MDFDLTTEQTMFQNMAKDFAKRNIQPVAKEDDHNEHYRPEILKELANQGLLGAPIPQAYQGLEADHICYAAICEEIACASAGIALAAFTAHTSLFQLQLLAFGNDEQKKKYLPRAAAGEILGCCALNGPVAGSEALSFETKAAQNGSDWVLNGRENWVFNGGIADVAMVFAVTNPTEGTKSLAAFLVEKGTPGLSSQDIKRKMGLRAGNAAVLSLQNCKVPGQNLIGKVGDGLKIAQAALDDERYSSAAVSLGVGRACIEATTQYAQQRRQFGKPVGTFPMIQEAIAEMITDTEAARYLVYQAGHLKNQGNSSSSRIAAAKYFASEAALKAGQIGLLVHGAYGYSDEYPIHRFFRDARGVSLIGGASQVQKMAVAGHALDLKVIG